MRPIDRDGVRGVLAWSALSRITPKDPTSSGCMTQRYGDLFHRELGKGSKSCHNPENAY